MPPDSRPPLPSFTLETAMQKVRFAEDAWNSRDPVRVARAYGICSRVPSGCILQITASSSMTARVSLTTIW
jgi:nuclear transport factor 2 (NTF2) superfamily protein